MAKKMKPPARKTAGSSKSMMSAKDMADYRNTQKATKQYNSQSNETNEKNARYAVSSYNKAKGNLGGHRGK